ncbi:hypothetical protein V6N13_087263 [Hibiscus sabdariffa]
MKKGSIFGILNTGITSSFPFTKTVDSFLRVNVLSFFDEHTKKKIDRNKKHKGVRDFRTTSQLAHKKAFSGLIHHLVLAIKNSNPRRESGSGVAEH